eukprot:6461361-Amphidinium_carterae.1
MAIRRSSSMKSSRGSLIAAESWALSPVLRQARMIASRFWLLLKMGTRMFAPGHCRTLEPKFRDLGKSLKNDKNIGIGAVDCEKEQASYALCAKYGVQGYPTLKASSEFLLKCCLQVDIVFGQCQVNAKVTALELVFRVNFRHCKLNS